MKQTLRDYQEDCIANAGAFLGQSPLIVAPTGSGKTTIGVHLVKKLLELGYSVCWIAHRIELMEQAAQRFEGEGVSVGFIKGGIKPSPLARVQIASIQTLANRKPTDYDIYVIDEAHRSVAESYMKCLPRHAIRIGLTATPYRLDGRGLGYMFGKIIEAPTVVELVEMGHLLAPEVWTVNAPTMRGVKKRGGDYVVSSMEALVDTPNMRADMVKQWRTRCEGLRTLCFAVSIEHSKHIVEDFNAQGVKAKHIDGGATKQEREDAIGMLKDGKIDMLSNVLLFTEGFDLPEIEALLLARPTASLCMHMQMVGRVMRPSGKAIVHDHVNNHVRLGMVTQPLVYSLDDTATVKPKSEPLGMRSCPECFRMYSTKENVCPSCGKE